MCHLSGRGLHLVERKWNHSVWGLVFLTVKLSSAWNWLSTYIQALSKSFISSLDPMFLKEAEHDRAIPEKWSKKWYFFLCKAGRIQRNQLVRWQNSWVYSKQTPKTPLVLLFRLLITTIYLCRWLNQVSQVAALFRCKRDYFYKTALETWIMICTYQKKLSALPMLTM